MSPSNLPTAVWVEAEVEFTLVELSRVCGADTVLLTALVEEGALSPVGAWPAVPDQWRFADSSLGRARTAVRLARDLEMNASATAMVLDLLDQIDGLRAQLLRLGAR